MTRRRRRSRKSLEAEPRVQPVPVPHAAIAEERPPTGATLPQLQHIENFGGIVHAPGLVLGDYVVHQSVVGSVDFTALPASALKGPPLPSSPQFVGRRTELHAIEARFDRSCGVSIVVVCGLGGLGKTELAIETAISLSETTSVYWIDASTRGTATMQFLSLGQYLGLDRETDLGTSIERVKGALDESGRYLLVFDNAAGVETVRHLLPTFGNGRVLITSTDPNWQALAEVIELGALPPTESAHLLFGDDAPVPSERARAFCDAFNGLPLGLAQARLYLEHTGGNVDELADAVAAETPNIWHLPPSERSKSSIDTVWRLAIIAATEGSPSSRALLNTLAFCSEVGMPRRRLTSTWLDLMRRFNVQPDASPAGDAIQRLRRRSLLGFHGDVVYVHPLLARHVRDQMGLDLRRRTVAVVIGWASNSLVLDPRREPPSVESMSAAHDVLAMFTYMSPPEIWTRTASRAARRATAVFRYWRLHEEASSLLEARIAAGDESHATVLESAHSLRLVGRYPEASERFRSLAERIPARARRHRKGDLDIFLGYASSLAGDHRTNAALDWFEVALVQAEQTYGSPSTEVARVRGRYGAAMRRLGLFAEARPLLEEAVANLVALHHAETTELAQAYGTLARCLTEMGSADEALPLAEEAARIRRRFAVAVPDGHPSRKALAQSVLGLASAHAALGSVDDCNVALAEVDEMFRGWVADGAPEYCQLALVRARLAQATNHDAVCKEYARLARNLAEAGRGRFREELAAAKALLA